MHVHITRSHIRIIMRSFQLFRMSHKIKKPFFRLDYDLDIQSIWNYANMYAKNRLSL